ncbi:MAG: leucyl/phenylalanyl-tRNA--protein transferase [Bryobacterales bacterium]|nr:leucyl/phenylalanyl-tRNA--protein transferase [Bryobacterales bacterium]
MEVVRITHGLNAEIALDGYRQGIFPMGYPGRKEITWHRPPVRAVLPLDRLHISRSLARTLKKAHFDVTFDRAFTEVMHGCADRDSTWITQAIFEVYGELHRRGHAHSVEVWVNGDLAGGLYGVRIGGAFFAESKFHRVTDMSKVALVSLVERMRACRMPLLEVQYLTEHLSQFGVVEINDAQYRALLREALREDCPFP